MYQLTEFKEYVSSSKLFKRVGSPMISLNLACASPGNPLKHTVSLCDDIMDLQRRMFPDSEIAACMALKRKRCATLVQVLGDHALNGLAAKLRKSKFSIIIDETTDCSVNKACAVIAKYFDVDECKIKTSMLDIINIYEGNRGSSGESLYNMILNCLNALQIPLSNIIGFAADGASNVMGTVNSVSSRLRQQMPGITIFRCVAHSIHLCSSEAAKTLPRVCEDLIRNIYNFFSHSAKRKYEFREFQYFCQVKPHKLLHPCATRWLSLHQAVARVLEQWQPLKLYFTQIALEERLTSVEQIHNTLNDPSVFCYLVFLNYILPQLNSINIIFQSKGPTLHLLHDKISNMYRFTTEKTVVYPHIIAKTPLHEIDPADENIHVPQ
ncbi:uncharacterized protein LOC135210952 [Macrobrachium nipponense]|uniref:uncharacterized protein LOC135210952 n=1 Tax=Macrobrachium nipponense TaxID=159736 RepID=UPI0030C82909